MKTLSTKKILLICIAFVIAAVAGLFSILCCRSASAAENDGIAAYADGEEEGGETGGENAGKKPGDSEIAPPYGFDDDEAFDIYFKEIIVEVDTLQLLVTGWKLPASSTSTAYINTNPDGKYSAELVQKIDALIGSGQLVNYSFRNMSGEEIKADGISSLPAGSSYFVHIDVNEKYSSSVELNFADGVDRSLAVTIGFKDNPVLEKVPTFEETEFTLEYVGVAIDVKKEVLNALMEGREDYLIIVESESDAYVQNGVGEYHYKVVFKTSAKYCWDNGNPNDRSGVDIIVKVTPMFIPTEVVFEEFYYTGLKINITEAIEKMFDGHVAGSKTSISAVNSGTVGEDVGEYEVKLVIKDEFASSIKWEGGAEFVIAKWNIVQTTVHGEWDTYGKYGTMNIESDIYKGGDAKAIKYTYTDITDGEPGVVVTKLEIGHKYIAEVELINDKNLKFTDDTSLTHIFDFTEEPVTLKKPVIEINEQNFTGEPLTFKVTINGDDIGEFSDYIEIVTDESSSLTQTAAGEYTVVIRLKEGVFWTSDDGGFFTNDERLTFTVKAIPLDYTFDNKTGLVTYKSDYKGSDYVSVVKCEYTDENGKVVTLAEMKAGKTYRGTLTLTDTENFFWKEGISTSFTFTLETAFQTIDVPDFEKTVFDFTGSAITNYPEGWDAIKEKVTVLSGKFVQTYAGVYEIIVKANEGLVWKGAGTDNVLVEGDIVKFVFEIRKADITFVGWQSNGTARFTSNSFTGGNYGDYVQYIYEDEKGNKYYSVADLQDGAKYTVTVSLNKDGEANFTATGLPATGEIEYKKDSGSSFPWWILLIIAAVLLIIIIIIIIIIVKRRRKDDDYDDYYDDEYYGDDDADGDGYGSDGGYDDYDDGYGGDY